MIRRLVLLGGGHAHVHVLDAFGRHPEPGVEVTLVSRDADTPYSGMLPGVVAGIYMRDEAHIDLARLCAAGGIAFVRAVATGIDRGSRAVLLTEGGQVGYDLLSVDVGIEPAMGTIAGAAEHAIAVKPIGRFLDRFDSLLGKVGATDQPLRIAMIGGGAGGVELLLAVRSRLRREHGAESAAFSLATAGPLLAGHNAQVRRAFRRVLAERGVAVHENRPVAAVEPGAVLFEDGGREAADAVLLATHAAAPSWFGATGLALDRAGFLAVGPTLQSLSDVSVFAAGDCAALVGSPREKAGVYAVRAGLPLARNLRAVLRGEEPRPWRPQSRHLALISTGDGRAVASWGPFAAEAAWAWRLKDRIDRSWIARYRR